MFMSASCLCVLRIAACQALCPSLLFCLQLLNRFLDTAVRDPRKVLQVSRSSILDNFEYRGSSTESRLSTYFWAVRYVYFLVIMNLGSWSFLHSIEVPPERWEIFNRWGQLLSYWTLSVLKENVNLYWGFYRSCPEYFLTENKQSWHIQLVNKYTVSGSRKKWTTLLLCTWYNVPHLSITFQFQKVFTGHGYEKVEVRGDRFVNH